METWRLLKMGPRQPDTSGPSGCRVRRFRTEHPAAFARLMDVFCEDLAERQCRRSGCCHSHSGYTLKISADFDQMYSAGLPKG